MMSLSPARYLDTGANTAAWNMAVDQLLFDACRSRIVSGVPVEEMPLTFRVYAWSPPALTLGRNQMAERDVLVETLSKEGVDLCRRLTGGRAVLHDQEITYSVIGPEAILGHSIEESYRRISAGLAAGLRRLGAPVTFAPPSGRVYASQASCFATTSVWELTLAGRKVVGSAQCREGGAVLQHGSILLRSQENRLASLLRGRMANGKKTGRGKHPIGHAVGLCEVLGREVSYREAAQALRLGMAEAFSRQFRDISLSETELERAAELVQERYGNPAWTLAR